MGRIRRSSWSSRGDAFSWRLELATGPISLMVAMVVNGGALLLALVIGDWMVCTGLATWRKKGKLTSGGQCKVEDGTVAREGGTAERLHACACTVQVSCQFGLSGVKDVGSCLAIAQGTEECTCPT